MIYKDSLENKGYSGSGLYKGGEFFLNYPTVKDYVGVATPSNVNDNAKFLVYSDVFMDDYVMRDGTYPTFSQLCDAYVLHNMDLTTDRSVLLYPGAPYVNCTKALSIALLDTVKQIAKEGQPLNVTQDTGAVMLNYNMTFSYLGGTNPSLNCQIRLQPNSFWCESSMQDPLAPSVTARWRNLIISVIIQSNIPTMGFTTIMQLNGNAQDSCVAMVTYDVNSSTFIEETCVYMTDGAPSSELGYSTKLLPQGITLEDNNTNFQATLLQFPEGAEVLGEKFVSNWHVAIDQIKYLFSKFAFRISDL